ncbi:MAG: DUF6569 family protein, partial [Bacteroidota bacterium]
MIRLMITLASSVFLFLPAFSQFTYDHLVVDYEGAITYRNLKLVPVRANYTFFNGGRNNQTPQNQPDLRGQQIPPDQQGLQNPQGQLGQPGFNDPNNLLSLQDALESGQLIIRDRAGVNQLIIENLSNRPVILMSGEILRGGKQDRVIGQDMVIPPNSKRNRVPVFCVEEKRWSMSPKSWTYYHQGSMHLRRVVDQSQNQRQVWEEIDYELKRDNIYSSSKAYTAHSKNRQYAALERDYLDAFSINNFEYPSNIIGIIGISGSVVIGCDLFATKELFQREYESIIFSYIDETIGDGFVDVTENDA